VCVCGKDEEIWKMSAKILFRAIFIFWAMAVAGLSVISYPGSKDLLMAFKLTRSGFVVHGIAYFLGISLCYFSFNKKNISFVFRAGLLVFLFGVVLEVIQFYLPYRTFNVYDIVGNGIGILLFGVLIFFFSHRPTRTDTDFLGLATDPHKQTQTFSSADPSTICRSYGAGPAEEKVSIAPR